MAANNRFAKDLIRHFEIVAGATVAFFTAVVAAGNYLSRGETVCRTAEK